MLTAAHSSFAPDVLRAANISPATYLATDFLNHYNEVAMLIDLLSIDPEVAEDILDWKPASYIDHFRHSGFRDRDLAIAAYQVADPGLISAFESTCATLDHKIIGVQSHLKAGDVETAAPYGKELYDDIGSLNALIVGQHEDTEMDNHDDSGCSQSEIDDLFS